MKILCPGFIYSLTVLGIKTCQGRQSSLQNVLKLPLVSYPLLRYRVAGKKEKTGFLLIFNILTNRLLKGG